MTTRTKSHRRGRRQGQLEIHFILKWLHLSEIFQNRYATLSKIVDCVSQRGNTDTIKFRKSYLKIFRNRNCIIIKHYGLCNKLKYGIENAWMNMVIATFLCTAIKMKRIRYMNRTINETLWFVPIYSLLLMCAAYRDSKPDN